MVLLAKYMSFCFTITLFYWIYFIEFIGFNYIFPFWWLQKSHFVMVIICTSAITHKVVHIQLTFIFISCSTDSIIWGLFIYFVSFLIGSLLSFSYLVIGVFYVFLIQTRYPIYGWQIYDALFLKFLHVN